MPIMPEQPIFMSTEPHPVNVDAELNLEPMYFSFSDESPVTFLMLGNSVHELFDALHGAETMLENIPDHLDIEPQRLMIKLALNHMESVLNNLLPGKPKSGRDYSYDRSTEPPSFQPHEEWLEKARAEEKARHKNLSQIRKEAANA